MVRWNGVAGMRHLRAELERDIVQPLLDPGRYEKYRVPLPNGILFFGPPGCGKTYIARKLAEIVGFNFVEVIPSRIGSMYVHGGQLQIAKLFDDARQKAPTLLFFDEFDALAPKRDSGALHHYEAEVNELLAQLNDCSNLNVASL